MTGYKHLLRIPVAIKPYLRKNDMLEVEYGEPIDTTCYVDYTITNIIDRDGRETISKAAFYIDGTDIVQERDLIVFDKEYSIKSLNPIRRKNGVIALYVVYV